MQKPTISEGGLYQVGTIAFFLMLSSLSGMAMMFIDRLMLAKFSLEAHNAIVEISNFGWMFQSGLTSLTSISQIFVSQYYGAGKNHLLSRPVWQMIWFSTFTFVFFIPLALFGSNFFFDDKIKNSYFFLLLLFVPIQGIFATLSSFFIGQKKFNLILIVVILGNIINSVLAYCFIFGIEGLIPSFGAIGAIIATNSALALQVSILFFMFWKKSKKYEKNFNQHYNVNFPLLKQCIQTGFPNALFSIIEALGWSSFYLMMASLSNMHLTVAGIIQNVLILSYFFGDGLRKAVSTLTGNAIGAQRLDTISKIVKSASILMIFFCIALGCFLWLMKDVLIECFLSDLSEDEKTLLYPALLFGLANAVIYKYLEGIRLYLWGVFNAASDTKFLLLSGAISVWVFMVLPVYFFVLRQEGSIEQAFAICSFYTLASAIIFIWRYKSKLWLKNANLIA